MSETSESILQEESNVTDITLTADGRIFLFGTSRQVLELLQAFQPGHSQLERLLSHLQPASEVDSGPHFENRRGLLLDTEWERT